MQACQVGLNRSIDVRFYLNGPSGKGRLLETRTADSDVEPATGPSYSEQCGSQRGGNATHHGFQIVLNANGSWSQGYVYVQGVRDGLGPGDDLPATAVLANSGTHRLGPEPNVECADGQYRTGQQPGSCSDCDNAECPGEGQVRTGACSGNLATRARCAMVKSASIMVLLAWYMIWTLPCMHGANWPIATWT